MKKDTMQLDHHPVALVMGLNSTTVASVALLQWNKTYTELIWNNIHPKMSTGIVIFTVDLAWNIFENSNGLSFDVEVFERMYSLTKIQGFAIAQFFLTFNSLEISLKWLVQQQLQAKVPFTISPF